MDAATEREREGRWKRGIGRDFKNRNVILTFTSVTRVVYKNGDVHRTPGSVLAVPVTRVDDTTAPLQPRKSVAGPQPPNESCDRIPRAALDASRLSAHTPQSAHHARDHASRRSSHSRLRARGLRGQTRTGRASPGPAAASAGRRRDAAVRRRRGPVGRGVRLSERAGRSPARDVRPGRGAPDARAGRVPRHGSPASRPQLEEPRRAASRVRLPARPFGHHARSPVARDRGYHRA